MLFSAACSDKSSQTDINMIDLANMERKLLQEQNERSNLEMRLNRAQLNEHFMEKREHAVKFYTGLPNFLTHGGLRPSLSGCL